MSQTVRSSIDSIDDLKREDEASDTTLLDEDVDIRTHRPVSQQRRRLGVIIAISLLSGIVVASVSWDDRTSPPILWPRL